MNNPFDYVPDGDCADAFVELMTRIDALKTSPRNEDIAFCRELEAGKMLGVLVASDADGVRHTLYAFSGQLGDGGFYFPGFVGPVFDYLQPDGYFKTHEADIIRQNKEIADFESGPLAEVRRTYDTARARTDAEVAGRREEYRRSKAERAARRDAGNLSPDELADMIRQSQFEKAELHRLKKRGEAETAPMREAVRNAEGALAAMKEKRRHDSEALQQWLFDNFKLLNARGETRTVGEIFAETPLGVPPSGAGECCAPKLLQASYRRGWTPVSIAEYWYGRPKDGNLRIHGAHYPACRGKCLPILRWMLQGLDVTPALDAENLTAITAEPVILFENEWFCVVDKPSGMLSVPGKGRAMSVQQWLRDRFGTEHDVRMAHRLDRDTSGLLIATFGEAPYKLMQSLFATRQIRKTYVAELECDDETPELPAEGRIDLPLMPDWLDRPRQRVDHAQGKPAITDYEIDGRTSGRVRIKFYPLTGRTHQLRVHAASEMGLGMPIAGDPLYAKNGGSGAARLLLHAHKIEFVFPLDGRRYSFESPVPF